LCGEVPGIAGSETLELTLEAGLAAAAHELGARTTGFFEIDDSRLPLQALGGTLIVEGGVVVPSDEHPSSAFERRVLAAACQDCGEAQPVAEASAGGVHAGFSFLLGAIVALTLMAVTVALVFFTRYLRSLEAEEAYLRERWGVRGRME
jgi:hypothetical protein